MRKNRGLFQMSERNIERLKRQQEQTRAAIAAQQKAMRETQSRLRAEEARKQRARWMEIGKACDAQGLQPWSVQELADVFLMASLVAKHEGGFWPWTERTLAYLKEEYGVK
jgi:cytochrome oxidase assembly protein ShyY1